MENTFDKPHTGRSKITEDVDGLQITLPAKKHILPIIFICVWLCVWAVGWTLAFMFLFLLQGGTGVVQAFLFIWLVAWSAGGILAMMHLGWMMFGQEQMTIDQSSVELRRTVGPFGCRRSFAAEHILHIRIVDCDLCQKAKRGGNALFSGFSQGEIRFDYGAGTLGFGLEMDPGEAKQIIDRINARFPQLTD